MRRILNLLGPLALACVVLVFAGTVSAQEQPFRFAGTTCTPAPYLHCPDSECSGATVVNQGNVVEMKTRRTYFLDYPCDLKKGEKVTFILSLHGGGSYGNWQRNYFSDHGLHEQIPSGDRDAKRPDEGMVRGGR